METTQLPFLEITVNFLSTTPPALKKQSSSVNGAVPWSQSMQSRVWEQLSLQSTSTLASVSLTFQDIFIQFSLVPSFIFALFKHISTLLWILSNSPTDLSWTRRTSIMKMMCTGTSRVTQLTFSGHLLSMNIFEQWTVISNNWNYRKN